MSLWRRVHGEVAGAWRSVSYDLGRRSADGPDEGPDVTSTGMGTFPGSLVEMPAGPVRTDARPPRRFVAVVTFSMLAVLGASGSYFAATSVFAEEPAGGAAAAPVKAVAAPAPVAADGAEQSGMGAGPGKVVRPRTTPPSAPPAGTSGAAATTSARTVTRPGSTTAPPPTRSAGPECHCATPPVPTPTAATSSPSPSRTGSPSPSATSGSPSADPSGSAQPAEPSESVEPEPTGDRPHRRRHRDWS
ncbi:hypothetical protein AB0M02_16475 [Actinoplanes sp. NPDC051861]|uniref:hypothetical protein n=1 Tax=Actinoplanes sp. NPDC051861 TaxID=3155170 RepID=UPI00341D9F74